MISGAVFLYFYDEPVGFTLHPSVSTFMTGLEPSDFFRVVEDRQPAWAQRFFEFVKYRNTYRAGLQETSKLLEPLKGTAFKSILLGYPRGTSALEAANELLSSSDLPSTEILHSIDPFSASDELFAHIFFEKYLELYFPDHTPEDFVAMGSALAEGARENQIENVDWSLLYQYCDGLFTSNDLEQVLKSAYMFRMPVFQHSDGVLLTNERLVPFLASLPVEPELGLDTASVEEQIDTVAWEFFRQLVSPILDPLDEASVQKLSDLIRRREIEIKGLKTRCFALAQELGGESDLPLLQRRIRDHIRVNVEKDVQEVLDLDKQAVNELLNSVFGDEKTWAGIGLFLYSMVNGGTVLTAASAIYALSSVGSKAFKAAHDQRQKLKTSDYALLYRMRGW